MKKHGPLASSDNDVDFRPWCCSTSEAHRALPTCCVASGSMELEMLEMGQNILCNLFLCPVVMHHPPSFLGEYQYTVYIYLQTKIYVY